MMECLRERVSGSFHKYLVITEYVIRDFDVTLINPDDAYWAVGVYISPSWPYRLDSYGEWALTGWRNHRITIRRAGLITDKGVEFRTGTGERNQFTLINEKEGLSNEATGLFVNGQRFMGWEELRSHPEELFGVRHYSHAHELIATTENQHYEHLCIGAPLERVKRGTDE